MRGATLVTHQTGPAGKEVKRVYIEDGCDIDRELYLSLLVDPGNIQSNRCRVDEGGMNIEEVAASTPEKIQTYSIDPATGMLGYHAREIAFGLNLKRQSVKSACVKFLLSMYKAFEWMQYGRVNPVIYRCKSRLMPK